MGTQFTPDQAKEIIEIPQGMKIKLSTKEYGQEASYTEDSGLVRTYIVFYEEGENILPDNNDDTHYDSNLFEFCPPTIKPKNEPFDGLTDIITVRLRK